jgi:ligand-binding sensor domain-containing protein
MRRIVGCYLISLFGLQMAAQEPVAYLERDIEMLKELAFRSMFEDAAGNLWLGTRGEGIFKLTDDKLFQADLSAVGIDFAGAASINQAADGRLFFTGRGVLVNQDNKWSILDQEKLKNPVVFNTYSSGDAVFFAGSRGVTMMIGGGEFSYFDGESEPKHPVVHDIVLDNDSQPWLATRKAGLQVWNESKKGWEEHYGASNCRKLLKTDNGDIWVGSSAGVIHFDAANQRVELLKEGELLMPEFEDAEGKLWFSSESSGVWTYKASKWTRESTRGSFDIIEKDGQEYWSATESGIEKIAY